MQACSDNPRMRKDALHLSRLSGGRLESTVVRWLMGDDEIRRELATDLVVSAGAAVSSFLVRKALTRQRRPHQSVRLLQAVEKIGKRLEMGMFYELIYRIERWKPQVQDQIVRALMMHRNAQ